MRYNLWYIYFVLNNIPDNLTFPAKVIFIFLSVCSYITVDAQPVANFTSSQWAGCVPLTNVQLTDQSTGSPTSWEWKKDGVSFSTLQNPIITFPNAGTFNITLIATNGSGSNSKSIPIIVHPNPSANFTTPSATSGCLPHTVVFNDVSTPGSGTSIASRTWAFGDGGGSTLPSASNTYTLAGNFPVSLKVIDGRGCEDTKQIPNFIQVFPLPSASFSSNSVRLSCVPPLTVAFINNSSGSGTLSYLWEFGDGQTSSSAAPSHTYSTFGTFSVKLTVTDQNGCKKSVTQFDFVKIQPIQADFSVSSDTICFGDSVTFINNSQNAISLNWNFGDNTTGTGGNVSHTYTDSGTFQVRFIASISASGCSDTVYKTIFVERVIANFTVSPEHICELPKYVQYTNHSVNGDQFFWYYGKECPDFVVPTCGKGVNIYEDSVQYIKSPSNRVAEGIYSDTLVAVSNFGCRDTMVRDTSVTISPLHSIPNVSQTQGCFPYVAAFSNLSTPYSIGHEYVTPLPTITSNYWFFDGSFYSNMAIPPPYNVVDTGHWNGYLAIENSLGCRDTAYFGITAGEKHTPDFLNLNDTICPLDFDTAKVLSQDTDFIDQYIWYSDPTSSIGQMLNHNGLFSPIDTGYHSITHIVGQYGCYDTITKLNQFYVDGPIIDIVSASIFSCGDTSKISFTSYMKGASKWYWDFGDPSLPIDSVSINPVVQYPKRGNYIATLTAYNADGSCSDIDDIIVFAQPTITVIRGRDQYFTPPLPTLSSYIIDTLHGCAPFTGFFNAHQSPGVMVTDWYIDGNPIATGMSPDSTVSFNFNTRGFYEVMCIGYDTMANCLDTGWAVVGAYKPDADFAGNPAKGCTPVNVNLEPTISTLNSIQHYNWRVGTISDTNLNFLRTYNSPVNLDTRLIVEDRFGCSDTVFKPNYVRASSFDIYFYASSNRQICSGDSVGFFQSLPVSNVHYTWAFGDGDTATGPLPFHSYLDSGKYDVTLIASDSGGCVREQIRPAYIEVQATPNAEFSGFPRDSTCYPLPVQFQADTTIVYFNDNTYYFKLGDYQAASNYPDPFYNYVRPGSYSISMVVTTPFGCIDSITKVNYINIGGPYGKVNIEPDSICIGDSVMFSLLDTFDISSYGWDFGDGFNALNVSPVYHTYRDSFGALFPNVYMTDSSGGCAKTFVDTIYIDETIAGFTFTDSIGCSSFDPGLLNQSVSPNSLTYKWDFGDGKGSSIRDPNKRFPLAGTFLVQLAIQSAIGCKDTVEQVFTVHPRPVASANPDTLICEGDTAQLFSDGGLTYRWFPTAGLSNPNIQNPLAYPEDQTNYAVEVADSNICKDTAYVAVEVQHPIILYLGNIRRIIGLDTFLIDAYGGPGVTYNWEPTTGISCDTCPRPTLKPLKSGYYSVTVTDSNNCFERSYGFNLEVIEEFTVDVPDAFSPNGDGKNDIIYVDGWGLKELLSFRIYNRWGQLLFESSDLKYGWDGTFKGRMQEVETYVYHVEAITYQDETIHRQGSFHLLR